jgi:hypothetical protein
MDGDYSWMWILVMFAIFMSMAKGGRLNRQHRKLQDRVDQLQSAPPPPPPAVTGPSRAEVNSLEQRVRVLERIVTDSGYTLASQIEALRDHSRAEARPATSKTEEKI